MAYVPFAWAFAVQLEAIHHAPGKVIATTAAIGTAAVGAGGKFWERYKKSKGRE